MKMKVPPPRSWKRAIGVHAPSPHVLAMAISGAAGLTACVVTSFSVGDDDHDTRSIAGTRQDADVASSATPRFVPGTPLPTVPRCYAMGTGPSTAHANTNGSMPSRPTPTTQGMLATSANMFAASDASAESSSPLASRLSRTPSAFSIGAQNAVTGNTTEGAFRTATGAEYDSSANKRMARRTKSNGPGSNDVDNDDTDERTPSPIEGDDSYPTFTPYHHSLLKKYLTPAVWAKLASRSTAHGTTLEDLIRAGVSLPIGANPPRRVGLLVGDAECYAVFRDLLDPIIRDYHGIDSYEEWLDPELPDARHFSDPDAGAAPAAAAAPPPGADAHGVLKSRGGAEDARDDDDDAAFSLDAEGVEEVALPATATTSASPPAAPADAAPAARHVHSIAATRRTRLRRHSTLINNPRLVSDRRVDPDGAYIVSTRVRVARSLAGVAFPPTMSRGARRQVQRLVGECTAHFRSPHLAGGSYLPVLSMPNEHNLDLIQRHILFDNPNEWTIASGLGRDWPDGRALYVNVDDVESQTPDFMIWVNEEDHLRIMCLRDGGDIQGVFTTLMNGVRELEDELRKRGWGFAKDARLGYLTSCPTNIGTTMRASVHVRLTNLGRLPGFFELVQRLKLEVRGKHGETDRQYTGVFDISNTERLGKSEVHLINVMVEGVAKLIELERRLEAGERVAIDDIARE